MLISTYLFNVSYPGTLNEQACMPIQIYATDIEDLYMTQDPLAIHLLEVDMRNVEEDMDLLPLLKFLAFNTGRRLSQLEGRLAGNGCSLRNKFQPKEIGSVETLVLKVHGVQEPCNELLPLTVQAVEGWVEINRQVTAVKSPSMVKHREGEISEAPVSKLYPRLMQNGVSEFYMVLLSAVFLYISGVRDQRNQDQELGIQIILEDKKAV